MEAHSCQEKKREFWENHFWVNKKQLKAHLLIYQKVFVAIGGVSYFISDVIDFIITEQTPRAEDDFAMKIFFVFLSLNQTAFK